MIPSCYSAGVFPTSTLFHQVSFLFLLLGHWGVLFNLSLFHSSQQHPDIFHQRWSAQTSPQTSWPPSTPIRLARNRDWSTLRFYFLYKLSAVHLPESLVTMPYSRSVYLHNNKLSDTGLPEGMFNGSDKLEVLILSSNYLRYVPKGLPIALFRLHLKVVSMNQALNLADCPNSWS